MTLTCLLVWIIFAISLAWTCSFLYFIMNEAFCQLRYFPAFGCSRSIPWAVGPGPRIFDLLANRSLWSLYFWQMGSRRYLCWDLHATKAVICWEVGVSFLCSLLRRVHFRAMFLKMCPSFSELVFIVKRLQFWIQEYNEKHSTETTV